jgi:hypothetical protein
MQDQPTYGYGLCECGCGGMTRIASRNHAKYGWVKGEPMRFIRGHAGRKARYYEERDCGYSTPCWIWLGTINSKGYGMIGKGLVGSPSAHRRMYEERIGLVPDGKELDHLCRVRACVNPAHLEPVTHRENVRRGWSARAKETT